MALVVETGTGSATSESYISVADADTYLGNRGKTDWAALTTAAKEQALRAATDYMEQTYRLRWAGYRRTDTQALTWPRYYVPRPDTAATARYGYGAGYYDYDAVPVEVKTACASLALRASTAELLADQTQRKSSVTIGPISTSYEAGSKLSITYAAVDALLRPMLKAGPGQINLVRA